MNQGQGLPRWQFTQGLKRCGVGRVCATALILVSCGAFPTPAPTPVPTATFIEGEEFECWTAPAITPEPDHDGPLLVVANSAQGADSLYRYDWNTQAYNLIAGDIEEHSPLARSPLSPDSQYVWYAKRDSGSNSNILFVYNLSDNTARAVPDFGWTGADDSVDWSLDGQCLLIWRENQVMAYRLADDAMQRKILMAQNDYLRLFDMSVYPSPDGQWLVWYCWDPKICMMGWDGQAITSPAFDIRNGYESHSLRWSPDSRILAFAYARSSRRDVDTIRFVYLEDGAITSYKDIYSYSVANMQWSPDNRHLLINTGDGETLDIYDRSTGDQLRIIQSAGYGYSSVWSPDGKRIAFVGGDFKGYVMDADGSNLTPLPSPAGDLPIGGIYWIP